MVRNGLETSFFSEKWF